MDKETKSKNLYLDEKEEEMLLVLTEKYDKLTKPGFLSKTGNKVKQIVPQKLKDFGKKLGSDISKKEIYLQVMNVLADGFKILEEQAAKCTISEKQILKEINKNSKYNIESLDEICNVRSYDISKLVSNYKNIDLLSATIEGASTGAFGFAGLPFNIALSTFLYFRAVQSIAMYYGYDVKNNDSELIIASQVFTNSLSPNDDINEGNVNLVGKIMVMSQLTLVKQTAKDGWSKMIEKGGLPLLLAQLRALANKAAKKALEKAGKSGLEKSVFRETLEQVGKKLSLKSLGGKSVPVAGAIIGGLMDVSQMKKVLDYADIFYHKRFILEKEMRINNKSSDNIVDAEFVELKK